MQISRYENDSAALRTAIYQLVNRRHCEACQYCCGSNKELIVERAIAVEAGGQCSRSEARKCFQEMIEKNQKKRQQ